MGASFESVLIAKLCRFHFFCLVVESSRERDLFILVCVCVSENGEEMRFFFLPILTSCIVWVDDDDDDDDLIRRSAPPKPNNAQHLLFPLLFSLPTLQSIPFSHPEECVKGFCLSLQEPAQHQQQQQQQQRKENISPAVKWKHIPTERRRRRERERERSFLSFLLSS